MSAAQAKGAENAGANHAQAKYQLLSTNCWVPGAVAQLGERLLCKQEVTGSIPVSSTKTKYLVISTWYLAKPDARILHDLLVLSSQHLAMITKLNTNY